MSKWFHTSRGKISEVLINPTTSEVVKQFRGFDDPTKNRRSIKGRGSHTHSFLRELECLRRLKGQEHFPQLIDHDMEDLWIKMSYCGKPYPCVSRPTRRDLMDQAKSIVDTLARVDIKYPYRRRVRINKREGIFIECLAAANINIWQDRLYLIDFEAAYPVGSRYDQYFEQEFKDYFKDYGYSTQEFRSLFADFLVPNGLALNTRAYNKIGDKQHMSTNSPRLRDTWNDYQNRPVGNNIADRIKSFGLESFADREASLLDVGANLGGFGVELKDLFREVHCVEPFAPAPDPMPDNMTWHKKGFREFSQTNERQYDLVLTFACTLQIAEIDLMQENEIAQAHAALVAPGGHLIYETQKQKDRERNQIHVAKIVANLRHHLGTEIRSGDSPRGHGRQFFVFQKTK
jgi:hypothetical protein